MNKKAAKSWKKRFAEDLFKIRTRVLKEKTVGVLAQNAPGASFAEALRGWFGRQTTFRRQLDLAVALRVEPRTVSKWFRGQGFPNDHWCDRLYKLSGLECFSPEGRIAARREHRPNYYANKSAR
jgi:hypothetical protein